MVNEFRIFDKGQWGNFSMTGEHEIFQSTGIKDKYGKMIFEGDYLYLENFDVEYDNGVEDFIDADEVREVVFEEGCFRVVALWDNTICCNIDMVNPELCKIVGNVKKTPITNDRIQEL